MYYGPVRSERYFREKADGTLEIEWTNFAEAVEAFDPSDKGMVYRSHREPRSSSRDHHSFTVMAMTCLLIERVEPISIWRAFLGGQTL